MIPTEFLKKHICFLESIYQDKEKQQWCAQYSVYRKVDNDVDGLYSQLSSLIKERYECGMVPGDYRSIYDSIGDETLYARKPKDSELAQLSNQQILSCISMQFRHDHFNNGVLINTYIAKGIMVCYMKVLLKRLGDIEATTVIHLNDLLRFDSEEISKAKVRFNQTSPQTNPMDLYLQDREIVNSQWLLWRTNKRYFSEGQIAICLLKLSDDTWLLTTIKQITKELNVENGVNYEAVELLQYQKYYGRVIVKFHKEFQAQCVYYNTVLGNLEVNQILPDTFDGQDFPGYDNVRLSYQQLATIINSNKRDWVAALENQKGVYLITDIQTGKLYIGSATSNTGMLLQRWKSYISNGHGGNKELIALVEKNGFDYVKQNFQYSILENFNAKTDDQIILMRESWWKETLLTRKFGYNSN